MADPRLSATAQAAIGSLQNQVLVSIATLWEIAIKVSIGKLTLPGPFESYSKSNDDLGHEES